MIGIEKFLFWWNLNCELVQALAYTIFDSKQGGGGEFLAEAIILKGGFITHNFSNEKVQKYEK